MSLRPVRMVLLAAILGLPTPLHAEWVRVETPNFIVIGEAGERRTREVAQEFERFREALGRVVGGSAVTMPVPTVVVAFTTMRSFEPYRPLFRGKPVNMGGLFVSTPEQNLVALAVESREQALRTIFHEYAHLVVSNVVGEMPVWLSEGLAEYYSTFAVQDSGRTAILGQVIPSHLRLLNQGRLIPLNELLSVDHDSPLYNEGERRSLFYAQSWALVHMLLLGQPNRSTELASYLRATTTGTPADVAWQQVFGDADISFELRRYVARSVMSGYRFRFDDDIPAVRGATAKASQADVEATLAELLHRIRSEEDATVRFERAVKMTPPSARARALLGLRHLHDGRADEARVLLAEAAEDRGDWLVQYYVATGMVRLVATGSGESGQAAEIAGGSLEVVLNARPDLPHALALKARLIMETASKPSTRGPDPETPPYHRAAASHDEGLQAIRRARALAPRREDYTFDEVRILVLMREYSAARQVLGPLMSGRHHPTTRDRARQVMGQIVRIEQAVAKASPAGTAAPADPGAGFVVTELPPRPAAKVRPVFRDLAPGEHRAKGTLERIECAKATVTLHVRIGNRVARFTAPTLDAIDFITYRDDLLGAVACGPRTPPDAVYVTHRAPTAPQADGTVVAVEFLPGR